MNRTGLSLGTTALEAVRKRNLARYARGVLWHASNGKVSLQECFGHASRGFAATLDNPLTESTTGILDRMLQNDAPASAGTESASGSVLSVSAGVAKVSLSGAVSVGGAVQLEGCDQPGIVVGFDRQGALVALLSGKQPRLGSVATHVGAVVLSTLRPLADLSGEARLHFYTPTELMTVRESSSSSSTIAESPAVFRLPSSPPVATRHLATQRLPSGLMAVEVLCPIAAGHRVGLTGSVRTGKSTAVQMLMQSQPEDTVCVYAALKSQQKLQSQLLSYKAATGTPQIIVVNADPASSSLAEQYCVPLCAARLAKELSGDYKHVLLVLDDMVPLLDVAEHLTATPFTLPHMITAALEMGASFEMGGAARSMTTIAVLDMETADELPRSLQNLWTHIEPSLDVHVPFSAKLASQGVLPAIDLDALSLGGFPAPYQLPLLRLVRADLVAKLQHSRQLVHQSSLRKQLGLHLEMDEEEEVNSAVVQSALLAHASPRPLPELVIIVVAALVFHFPTQRPVPSTVANFQDAVVWLVREQHKGLWQSLSVMDTLSADHAQTVLLDLGHALLRHRLEFHLARPDFLL
mmetsp:Transcript_43749/g.79867  ORF Transcript_43749/g.79867 Transcript_43749/m.79867 type:complete len:579 (-) Transcript_43749:172-1908(-)